MRLLFGAGLAVGLLVVAVGCERTATYEGPKVDKFTGRLVHDGKPVNLPASEKVQLKVWHEKGETFNIPIKNEGSSFDIGWMPIGKYTASLIRAKEGGKGMPAMYSVPGGLEVQDGKTDYTIELGKGFKL